jgi:hypothetical protein
MGEYMSRNWRKKAQFYARLASLETLNELSVIEAQRLEREAAQLGSPWPSDADQVARLIGESRRKRKLPPVQPGDATPAQLSTAQRQIIWVMINAVHPYIKKWLSELIDHGRTMGLPMEVENELLLTQDVVHPVPTHPTPIPDRGYPRASAILDGYWLLYRTPFPFRRCLQCRTIFFVDKSNQKYCSPSCSKAAIQAVRKETRREYMKRYQREYYLRHKESRAA